MPFLFETCARVCVCCVCVLLAALLVVLMVLVALVVLCGLRGACEWVSCWLMVKEVAECQKTLLMIV